MTVTVETIDAQVASIQSEMIAWRRHLHEHPEVSFHEEQTAQYVYDTLSEFGHLELTRPTKTSVVARLVGAHPGMVLALRADMDALPIHEENDVSYKSRTPGVMHACGHDGHTAMLLAAAKLLSAHRDEINGEIRFIFQHAEEVIPGGAQELVKKGVLDGVDAVVGQHLWAPMETKTIGVSAGPLMASPDTFHLVITGQGGHAAQPHLNVDPIAIGAQIVTNLQHLVSRYVDPFEPLVVSVTKFIGGTADNVIPNSVELCGTVRAFRDDLRDQAAEWMERVIRGLTEAHGAHYEFHYEKGYRPVINDEEVTNRVKAALENVFPADVVQTAAPTMGGEDFSAYQTAVPGTFFFTGIYNEEKDVIYPHHHPRFNIDEDALQYGVKALLAVAYHFSV